MNDSISESYLYSLKQHADDCEANLKLLAKQYQQGPLNRIQQLAAERTLQVLLEATIGAAKHWAKKVTGHPSNEAMKAFNQLLQTGLISDDIPWRKMVGLRNTLVHDYLDVDPEIVKSVITERYYLQALDFIQQAIEALSAGEEQ